MMRGSHKHAEAGVLTSLADARRTRKPNQIKNLRRPDLSQVIQAGVTVNGHRIAGKAIAKADRRCGLERFRKKCAHRFEEIPTKQRAT